MARVRPADVDNELLTDRKRFLEKYRLPLDEYPEIKSPSTGGIENLFRLQRMQKLQVEYINLRDQVFNERGCYVFTVGQFLAFWSYYDGFLQLTARSDASDPRAHFRCRWRACPAVYFMHLLLREQDIVLVASQEHHHSIMDSVMQGPLCSIVQWQALDALAETNYARPTVVWEYLQEECAHHTSLSMRVGMNRIDVPYLEQLRGLYLPALPELEEPPPSKRRRL